MLDKLQRVVVSNDKINRALSILRNHNIFKDIVYDSKSSQWKTRDVAWREEMINAFEKVSVTAKRHEYTIRNTSTNSSSSKPSTSSSTSNSKKARVEEIIYNIYTTDITADGSEPDDEDRCLSIYGGTVTDIAKRLLEVASSIFTKDQFINEKAITFKNIDDICVQVTSYYFLTSTSY